MILLRTLILPAEQKMVACTLPMRAAHNLFPSLRPFFPRTIFRGRSRAPK
jgi:hypothetical protein